MKHTTISPTQTTQMKAITYKTYGTPDVLQLETVPKPTPKPDELLVKVHTTTVSRTDCAMLTAEPAIMRLFLGLFKPKNPVLGTEFSGEVEAVGEKVTKFQVGDRIFGFYDPGLSSYAEYLTIAEDKPLATIPDHLSYENVAGSIEGAHYAYNFINKVYLRPGDKVIVNGATGAIGSAAVQLLKYYGADVTAVCNTPNIELVKALGANRTIDYFKEDFTKDEEKYHFVFDAVGKSSFGQTKHLLLPKGSYISSELGWMAQNIFYSLTTPTFGGKQVKFPIPTNIQGSINLVKKLMEEGKYKPVVDRTYSLEEIPDAFRYVETGKKTGNVVILCG